MSVKNKIHNSFNKILDKKNLKKLYLKFTKRFEIKSPFAVAVSGGPDSLALAFLSKTYAEKNRLITKYFIVDHKLRQNSTKEALVTKRLLRKLRINAKILTWKGKKPKSNIQAVARNKRYELLINECKKLKINHLLLGHHADDNLADTGSIGDRRAGHTREDQRGDDVDVAQPAAEAADHGDTEVQQSVRDRDGVHDIGRDDKQRHAEQHEALENALDDLLARQREVHARNAEVDQRSQQDRVADRGADPGKPEQGDEKQEQLKTHDDGSSAKVSSVPSAAP